MGSNGNNGNSGGSKDGAGGPGCWDGGFDGSNDGSSGGVSGEDGGRDGGDATFMKQAKELDGEMLVVGTFQSSQRPPDGWHSYPRHGLGKGVSEASTLPWQRAAHALQLYPVSYATSQHTPTVPQ